jgi:2,3-bisphosphoglycerate-independent phosphoglycerate mutase
MLDRILVLFVDGVGLGDEYPEINPLARADLPIVRTLLDGRRPVRANGGYTTRHATLLPLDAQMGVPGLPQSGTGQTSILTGVNAPALLGQHYGPYPNQALRDLLGNGNLFRELLAAGRPVAFANAYPDRFLNRLGRGTERLSANSRAAFLAGLKLRGPTELKAGRAVSSLLTNKYWREWGYDVPELTAAQAGAQLARLTEDHVLTYFEFWYTDVAGHRQDRELALYILEQLDEFIGGIIEAVDMSRSLLVILSDHGNFEDLSTPKHTLNPALCLLVGAGHQALASHLGSLQDVAPALKAIITDDRQDYQFVRDE